MRILANLCFWLCFFPVLFGAFTIVLAPGEIAHYREGLSTPGTAYYHSYMQRALLSTIANVIVRAAGVVLLAGFATITSLPTRSLQIAVFVGAMITTAAHLALPIVRDGPYMMVAWVSPLYFLPLASAILSGVGLWLVCIRRTEAARL